MEIKKKEILHIANLANLEIKEEEIEEYRKNLQDILEFADVINKENTENVEEETGISSNVNVFRADEIKEFEDNDLLLANAPEKQNNMFKIPKVI